jgi:hypothetical protein
VVNTYFDLGGLGKTEGFIYNFAACYTENIPVASRSNRIRIHGPTVSKKVVSVGGNAKSDARDTTKPIQDPDSDLTINMKTWPESPTIRSAIVAVMRPSIGQLIETLTSKVRQLMF